MVPFMENKAVKYKIVFLITMLISNDLYPKYIKGIIDCGTQKNIPSFSIFYKGTQTYSDKCGLFTIPEDAKENNLSILICRNFKPIFNKKNTITALEVNQAKPYKYFIQFIDEEGETYWEETRLKSKYVPENAIIIRMNPKHVQNTPEWNTSIPKQFIKLPKIAIKKSVTKKELQKASDKSNLSSLNEKRFHKHANVSIKDFPEKNLSVSLTY